MDQRSNKPAPKESASRSSFKSAGGPGLASEASGRSLRREHSNGRGGTSENGGKRLLQNSDSRGRTPVSGSGTGKGASATPASARHRRHGIVAGTGGTAVDDDDDDAAGEAPRNADGSRMTRAQRASQYEDDDGDSIASGGVDALRRGSGGGNDEAAGPLTTHIPVFMKNRNWRSTVAVKASVEAHQQRLAERQEVMKGLKAWVHTVMTERAPAMGVALKEHVDAEQLDLGDETKASERPDPTGVGAALKAHWQRTVRDEVEGQILKIRTQWEEDRRIEMKELMDMREECKTLRKTVTEYKDQFNSLTHKNQLLERQLRRTDPNAGQGAPGGPASVAGQPPEEEEPEESMEDLGPDPIMEIGRLKASIEDYHQNLATAHKEKQALKLQLAEANARAEKEQEEKLVLQGLLLNAGGMDAAVAGGAAAAERRASEEAEQAKGGSSEEVEALQEEVQRLRGEVGSLNEENARLAEELENTQAELTLEQSEARQRDGEGRRHSRAGGASSSGAAAAAAAGAFTPAGQQSLRSTAGNNNSLPRGSAVSVGVGTGGSLAGSRAASRAVTRANSSAAPSVAGDHGGNGGGGQGGDEAYIAQLESELDEARQQLRDLGEELEALRRGQLGVGGALAARARSSSGREAVVAAGAPLSKQASQAELASQLSGRLRLSVRALSVHRRLTEPGTKGARDAPGEAGEAGEAADAADAAAAAATVELEMERHEREGLLQDLETGLESQLQQLQEDASDAGEDAAELRLGVMDAMYRLRQWAKALIRQYAPNGGLMPPPMGADPPPPLAGVPSEAPSVLNTARSARSAGVRGEASTRSAGGSRRPSRPPSMPGTSPGGVGAIQVFGAGEAEDKLRRVLERSSRKMEWLLELGGRNGSGIVRAAGDAWQGLGLHAAGGGDARALARSFSSMPQQPQLHPPAPQARMTDAGALRLQGAGAPPPPPPRRRSQLSLPPLPVAEDEAAAVGDSAQPLRSGTPPPGTRTLRIAMPHDPADAAASSLPPTPSQLRQTPTGGSLPQLLSAMRNPASPQPSAQHQPRQTSPEREASSSAGAAAAPGPFHLPLRDPVLLYEALQPLLSVRGLNGQSGYAATAAKLLNQAAGIPDGGGPFGGGGEGGAGGFSNEMLAALGPDAAWQPLLPSQRPTSAAAAARQQRRPHSAAVLQRAAASPPRGGGAAAAAALGASAAVAAAAAAAQPGRSASPALRAIVATPQKGFSVSHGRLSAGRPGDGARSAGALGVPSPAPPGFWSAGKFVALDYGEGLPQVPPGPLTFVSASISGFSMGLSPPMVGVQLSRPSTAGPSGGGAAAAAAWPQRGPTGNLLVLPRDEWAARGRAYTTLEQLTRSELVQHVRYLQEVAEGLGKQTLHALDNLGRSERVCAELAHEVQESREHWMAEHQYGAMLAKELQAAHALLTMVEVTPDQQQQHQHQHQQRQQQQQQQAHAGPGSGAGGGGGGPRAGLGHQGVGLAALETRAEGERTGQQGQEGEGRLLHGDGDPLDGIAETGTSDGGSVHSLH